MLVTKWDIYITSTPPKDQVTLLGVNSMQKKNALPNFSVQIKP